MKCRSRHHGDAIGIAQSDSVARFGGDEFCALLVDVDESRGGRSRQGAAIRGAIYGEDATQWRVGASGSERERALALVTAAPYTSVRTNTERRSLEAHLATQAYPAPAQARLSCTHGHPRRSRRDQAPASTRPRPAYRLAPHLPWPPTPSAYRGPGNRRYPWCARSGFAAVRTLLRYCRMAVAPAIGSSASVCGPMVWA